MPIPDYAIQKEATPAEFVTVMAKQDTPSTHTLIFKNKDGVAIDLSSVDSVKFIAKSYAWDSDIYVDKECSITDAITGTVEVSLTKGDMNYGGVFIAELVALDASSDALHRSSLYLNVDLSLQKVDNTFAPLTIPDLRLSLFDRDPNDNCLLEALEFTDSTLAYCLRRPIDIYNELPPLGSTSYTPDTFPYRANWITGALAEVYKIAARKLIRNEFPVQASGISIDDKQRSQAYVQWGAQLAQEFDMWARERKYHESVNSCFGSTSNPYF